MAQKPTKSSGLKVSNIMGLLRGNFDLPSSDIDSKGPVAYGTPELISAEAKTKILSGAFRSVDRTSRQPVSSGSLINMVQASFSKVGQERSENRKILKLNPTVDKAARLMIASIFAPNDLTRHEISVVFHSDEITDSYKTRLSEKATTFFQQKLNLKTEAPKWVYQFGYEAGAVIFAIIPLTSFGKIEDESYIGTEAFVTKVIEPLCHESLFGFGDHKFDQTTKNSEIIALESFTDKTLVAVEDPIRPIFANGTVPRGLSRKFIEMFTAQESLNLTDNPAILQATNTSKDKTANRTAKILNQRYKAPKADPLVSVSADNEETVGNPIFIKLPPESVTIIHTPGDPSDHQGYLVLLDPAGSPINALTHDNGAMNAQSGNQQNIFQQTYNAYGLGGGNYRSVTNNETMGRIYTQIVSEHIRNRLDKAGYQKTEMPGMDAVFRCMFSRFLQQKQTRMLFLPKDLVTYMTFEMDEFGYGVSRLDGIKFSLSMKMAIQVSRVLAAIKAAMDKRTINVKFTENLMESPESVFEDIVRQYSTKSAMTFSTDPNVIQSQIIDKSLSIKGSGIPGMEDFEITNDPDTRATALDFDPTMQEYLDKDIVNGLHVPASTMNSLSEDEYSRSVVTTNLFFSMDVSIDQDTTIKYVSDVIRKYATFSEEFREEMTKIAPELMRTSKTKSKSKSKSSTDESQLDIKENEESGIPEGYTLDMLIESMHISLPTPSIAPSKAQFESLEAMTTAITNMMVALFPDDLAGPDDRLRPVISMLRTKFTAANIKSYLDGSGMSGLNIPDADFTTEMKDIGNLNDALVNVMMMMQDKIKLSQPTELPIDPAAGYQ